MKRNIKTGVATNTLISKLNAQYLGGLQKNELVKYYLSTNSTSITNTQTLIEYLKENKLIANNTTTICQFVHNYSQCGMIKDSGLSGDIWLTGRCLYINSLTNYAYTLTFFPARGSTNLKISRHICIYNYYDNLGGNENTPFERWDEIPLREDLTDYVTKTEFNEALSKIQANTLENKSITKVEFDDLNL